MPLQKPEGERRTSSWSRITSYNVCYTKLLRVGAEDHGDGRFVDADAGQGAGALAVGDGVADVDLFDAGNGDDVAGGDAGGLDALEPAPAVELGDLHRPLAAVGRAQQVLGAALEGAVLEATDGEATDVVVVVEVVALELGRLP